MLDTVKINHVQHISFTQSRLTDAVSVILSELLSYEHPSKGVVIFMVEAGRVELPSENPSMETSPGADGYSGRRDRPVPLAPGKPSRLEVR